MRVAGLMSGTSLDGLSVAYVDVESVEPFKASFIDGRTFAYPEDLRGRLLSIAEGGSVSARDIAYAQRDLGVFAKECLKSLKGEGWGTPELVGFHGQTVYHEGRVVTLQLGDPSHIYVEFGCPVVSDFRSADIAAGGEGAPLVPLVDYLKYRDKEHSRVVLNIGGIANITYLPRGRGLEDVVAFDTGPGVMLVDRAVNLFVDSSLRYDVDAKIARRGRVSAELLDYLLEEDDYRLRGYPKSTGRERYGGEFLLKIWGNAKRLGLAPEDVVATLSEYTVFMIEYHAGLVASRFGLDEIIAGGGGTRNPYIMSRLKANRLGVKVSTHEDYGVPRDYWECYAFAVLAYLTRSGYAGNIPSVTGANKRVVLGRINPPLRGGFK